MEQNVAYVFGILSYQVTFVKGHGAHNNTDMFLFSLSGISCRLCELVFVLQGHNLLVKLLLKSKVERVNIAGEKKKNICSGFNGIHGI